MKILKLEDISIFNYNKVNKIILKYINNLFKRVYYKIKTFKKI